MSPQSVKYHQENQTVNLHNTLGRVDYTTRFFNGMYP